MADIAKPQKLRALLEAWPKGTVAVQPWLSRQGVSRFLAKRYHQYQWVKRIGSGAYIRPTDSVDWTGGLYAMQTQLDLPVHAGGKTALELQGYGHFVPLGEGGPVYLFGEPKVRLPAWFLRHSWKVRPVYATKTLFPGDPKAGLSEKSFGDYSMKLSTPERAMLELLTRVSDDDSFEEARLLMEGLLGLRPEFTQELLATCGSVKAKRLFLFLADLCGHGWVDKLDVLNLDLGKGKRSVVKGGRLDPRYQITVPARTAQPASAPESA
jgi:hypothetical protein